MDNLVARLNIDHFRKALATGDDVIRQRTLLRLLAEEEAKLTAIKLLASVTTRPNAKHGGPAVSHPFSSEVAKTRTEPRLSALSPNPPAALGPPTCCDCSIEMKRFLATNVANAPELTAHFFQCPNCNRLEERRVRKQGIGNKLISQIKAFWPFWNCGLEHTTMGANRSIHVAHRMERHAKAAP